MAFFKTIFLFAFFGFVFVSSKSTGDVDDNGENHDGHSVLNEYSKYLKGDHGVLCLNNACVGIAGNQKGFVTLKKGLVLTKSLEVLPEAKHVAKDNIACFNGACIGLNNNKPFMGYVVTKKTGEDVLNIKGGNGFICLEGACIHVMGNHEDTTAVLKNLKENGVNAELATNVELCFDGGCVDKTDELKKFNGL